MAKSDAQISLRLSKKLKEELTAQAKRERRSVTALILRVMEEYLKNSGRTNLLALPLSLVLWTKLAQHSLSLGQYLGGVEDQGHI